MSKIKYDTIKISYLEKLAYEFQDKQLTRDEILSNKLGGDLTKEFLNEIDRNLRVKEIIRMNVNGRTRTGKSLFASTITNYINSRLGNEMSLKYIALDQIAFGRKIKDKTIKNCCIQIDEYNAYGDTGVNATTESAWLSNFNEVQAKRNIHQLRCSPARDDAHSNMILQTIEKDEVNKKTKALLFYRINDPARWFNPPQLLGYVNIYVGDTLKQPWHKLYEKRKDMAIELYGNIRDQRDLFGAELILNTYKKLKNKVRYMSLSRDDLIVYIKSFASKENEQLSLLAMKALSDPVFMLLKPLRSVYKIEGEIDKIKISTLDMSTKKKRISELQEQLEEIEELNDLLLDDYKRLVKINTILKDIEEGVYDSGKEIPRL